MTFAKLFEFLTMIMINGARGTFACCGTEMWLLLLLMLLLMLKRICEV